METKLNDKIPILLAIFIAFCIAICISTTPAYAQSGNWMGNNAKGWWYQHTNGTYPTNTWEKINGKWYHFNKSGYMQTGWLKNNKKWYYLKKSGAMSTGWIKSNNKWYYLNKSGAMVSNKWIGNYYLQSDGSMATNCWVENGKYYVNSSGEWDSSKTHTYKVWVDERGHFEDEYIEEWVPPVTHWEPITFTTNHETDYDEPIPNQWIASDGTIYVSEDVMQKYCEKNNLTYTQCVIHHTKTNCVHESVFGNMVEDVRGYYKKVPTGNKVWVVDEAAHWEYK